MEQTHTNQTPAKETAPSAPSARPQLHWIYRWLIRVGLFFMFALITGMVCSLYKYKPQTPYIPLLCIVLPTYLLQSYLIILIERRKLNKILPPIPAGEQNTPADNQ